MKTLNIFAILLIVTFVNTSKSISYSDIAQSLVQLHDVPTEGLAKLNEIAESFADSHKNLEAVISVNGDMCERLDQVQKNVAAGLSKGINNANDQIAALAINSEENADIIKRNVSAQQEEVKKIQEAAAGLRKEAKNMLNAEAELEEVVNVLERLKNIAHDELSGNTKINTEMGQYKVVNNHGVSFIQRSNMKQELHALLNKSQTASKSLISTLIMMASNDDGHYSDPKIVAKIIAVLDKIIASNVLKKNNLRSQFTKDSQMNQEIIENATEMIDNLKEGTIKASFGTELNNKETLMFNRDLQYFQGAQQRRGNRNAFNKEFCKKQQELMEKYQKRYADSTKQFQTLKDEINA